MIKKLISQYYLLILISSFIEAIPIMKNIKLHFIVDLDESMYSAPSLGIGYLSSYLKEKYKNISITLSLMSDNIFSDVKEIKPNIIGISCTSRFFIQFKLLAKKLKETFKIPIIWGGVHISISPNDLPSFIDVGVIGEGEETLLELISNFVEGHFTNLKNIKGIVYFENGEFKINEKRSLKRQLDDIPFPDWDLLRVKWNRSRRAVMLTSRGCPFKCSFCASPAVWSRSRKNSAEYILKCVNKLVEKYRVREILIYDDFFTISTKQLVKLAILIKREQKLKRIRFECLSRVDTFNKDIARLLKDIGVYRVSFGIESGSQNTLNYLKNKTLKIEQAENAIKIAKSMGFECVASFMIGSPFETKEDIEETFAFINKLKLDSIQISITTPFPGTKLWEDGKIIGKIKNDDWSDNYYVLSQFTPDFIIGLQNKTLLTSIHKEEFINLVKTAALLVKKFNKKPNRLKRILRILKFKPMDFPWKIIDKIKYHLSR